MRWSMSYERRRGAYFEERKESGEDSVLMRSREAETSSWEAESGGREGGGEEGGLRSG